MDLNKKASLFHGEVMTKACLGFIFILSLIFLHIEAAGVVLEESVTTSATVTIDRVFRIESREPDGTSIVFSDSVPFLNINPKATYALPIGRSPNDGKSDIGINCVSTEGVTWYLKIGITGGNVPPNKLKYYVGQPYIWTGSKSMETDGAVIPSPPAWTPIPQGSNAVIYRSGDNDTSNMPYGTLVTVNYQLDTQGLVGGQYTAVVTYTMTTTP